MSKSTFDFREAETKLEQWFKDNNIEEDKRFPAYKHSEINPNSNYTILEGETVARDNKRWLALIVRNKYQNPVQKSKHVNGDDTVEPRLEIIQFYWINKGGRWLVHQWCNFAVTDIDIETYSKVYKSLKTKYFKE